jgi:hypothetical protein
MPHKNALSMPKSPMSITCLLPLPSLLHLNSAIRNLKQTEQSAAWCLRHYATSRNVGGSGPDEVIDFINLLNHSRDRNTKMFLPTRAWPVHEADDLVSRLSKQCGIFNISQPYRPPLPVKGIAFRFYMKMIFVPNRTHIWASTACYRDSFTYIYFFVIPFLCNLYKYIQQTV